MSAMTVISVLAMAILVIAIARKTLGKKHTDTITVSGKAIEVDEEGYLQNLSDWSEEGAREMARLDSLELTPDHWEVINLMREYYDEYQLWLPFRVLTKIVGKKLGPDKGNSKYLYELFPHGSKQANKYAGLPRPRGG